MMLHPTDIPDTRETSISHPLHMGVLGDRVQDTSTVSPVQIRVLRNIFLGQKTQLSLLFELWKELGLTELGYTCSFHQELVL